MTNVLVGMDEVGRGCWAGPVVVGAVVLNCPIEGLRDSKRLTKRQREALAATIHESSLAYAIGEASPSEIDAFGLTQALRLAYERALQFKADALTPAVSAASIIAKVYRDNLMAKQSISFPMYGFERHVGYGTAAHMKALAEYGPCELHRRSVAPVAKALERI